jgi:peptidoglycan/xylan/chitin deacetylase (PgdA/CDA1 family)
MWHKRYALRPDSEGRMETYRAGLLTAALVAALGAPFAAGSARAQDGAQGSPPAAAQNQAPDQTQAAAQNSAQACPGNPNALGTSRVLAVDPAQLPRVGRMQYPDSLPLADKEVVLTFDDGPLPPYSNQILDILASECVKATYFLVGEMARAYPAVVRRIYEQGHTIGTHSDTHPTRFGSLPIERMRYEIDNGISDVSAALGDPKYLAPFFRIPGLERSDTAESELAARGLIVFSSDTVADDWHHNIKPDQIMSLALKRLEARGKGILLLHDIHPKTVAALPGLLKGLKDNGFRIVQVVPAASYQIAMASKPAARMLASAIPEQLNFADGIGGAAHPSWPETTASLTPDEVMLPAPDPSAFDPDSGLADSSDVQWPAQPQTITAAPSPHLPASSERETARSAWGHRHEATGSIIHTRRHAAEQPSARAHARAGAAGHHADLVSELKSVASLFTTPVH